MNEIGQNTKFLIVGLGLMGGSYAGSIILKRVHGKRDNKRSGIGRLRCLKEEL